MDELLPHSEAEANLLDDICIWMNENKEWFFSGAGLAILSAGFWLLGRVFKKRSRSLTQSIRSGDSSSNTQAGRDINFSQHNSKNDATDK